MLIFPWYPSRWPGQYYINKKQYLSPPQECQLTSRRQHGSSLGLIFVREISGDICGGNKRAGNISVLRREGWDCTVNQGETGRYSQDSNTRPASLGAGTLGLSGEERIIVIINTFTFTNTELSLSLCTGYYAIYNKKSLQYIYYTTVS